ncbi:protease inhibitor Inh/omp19 family protein [Nitratireductor basaltis]|nr:protease inhibitor Inh/omp19 family protein [Nitratireductor basaltis]
MRNSKTGLIAVSLMALALAGCQSGRLNPIQSSAPANPQPLNAAPAGQVTTNRLPPPANPSQFPQAPASNDQTQMAAVDPTDGTDLTPGASASANAADISKNSLVGSWSVASGGASCQMFLTLTKYGNASRGGTRGCSGDLQNMRGWDVAGKQLVLYDDSGNTIGRLYSSGAERLDGQTSGGSAVSLSR